MDDTKLLEDAARAIGRNIKGWNTQHVVSVAILDDDTFWQPLYENNITDCMGDALRLAVRVNLELCIASPITYARMAMQEGISAPISEFHAEDAMAATRRAIVRAAAQMGE